MSVKIIGIDDGDDTVHIVDQNIENVFWGWGNGCGAYPIENSSMMYPDSDDFELIMVHYSERFDWCSICVDIYYYDSYMVQLTDEEKTYILELRNSLTAAANAHRDGIKEGL